MRVLFSEPRPRGASPETGARVLFTEPRPRGASPLKRGRACCSPNPARGRRGLTSAGVDGGGAERLPHDSLTDVRGDEQGDPGAQAVPLLQQLVQKQNNQASHKELSVLRNKKYRNLERLPECSPQPGSAPPWELASPWEPLKAEGTPATGGSSVNSEGSTGPGLVSGSFSQPASALLSGRGGREGASATVPAQCTCMVMSRQTPAPISDGSPYIPVITYTMDCPMVMVMPNTVDERTAACPGPARRPGGHGDQTPAPHQEDKGKAHRPCPQGARPHRQSESNAR